VRQIQRLGAVPARTHAELAHHDVARAASRS